MRRSRGISFKREQEQKLNSLLNRDGNTNNSKSSSSTSGSVSLAPHVRPDFRSMREAIKDIRDSRDTRETKDTKENKSVRAKSAVPKNVKQQVESDEEDLHDDHEEQEEHQEEHSDEERYEEEEEEVKPVVKGRALKPNNHKNEIKKRDQKDQKEVKEEEVKPKTRGRKPKTQEVRQEDREEEFDNRENRREEEDHESERTERKERGDKKMIVPKSFFQKMTSSANIDTTSSDIYYTLQLEMIEYIVEVIKIVSNNDDEEIVVKDSNLRFLGDKDKAVGSLDVKLFEKLYSEAQKILSHNVTFTSESFKSLCKYTEIHLMDFLKKARAIMVHSGRKRLTLSDIELLKFILE
jgi:hypothetical protein